MDTAIVEVVEKSAIRDVLSRYCRSLDRMDKPMAYSVFAEEAEVRYYGIFEGSGHGFIDWVWDAHLGLETHSHQINNVLTEVTGDSAVSEAYVTVVLQRQLDDGAVEMQVRGRYLDRWRKRSGHWQIVEREHVIDTQSQVLIDAIGKSKESQRDRSDPSFRFFK